MHRNIEEAQYKAWLRHGRRTQLDDGSVNTGPWQGLSPIQGIG
ncbi:hypothetical protein ACN3VN_10815 [Xylella fastidiosa]|nr:hypothetical protein [Xylella fastidiosa]